MLFNVLLLIISNVFIPLIPIPPEIFLTYNVYQYLNREPTVYDDLNLNRNFNH